MANPSDKQMLRDANGDLIPQYWDVVAGDFKPLTGSDGAQDTRLTGSNVEDEVFKREIRSSTANQSIVIPPPGAVGFRAELSVHSATGTFAEDEGIRLLYWDRTGKRSSFIETYTTEMTSGGANRGQHAIVVHPSVTEFSNSGMLTVSNVIGTITRFQIIISGTFKNDEGFDCELHVRWLF